MKLTALLGVLSTVNVAIANLFKPEIDWLVGAENEPISIAEHEIPTEFPNTRMGVFSQTAASSQYLKESQPPKINFPSASTLHTWIEEGIPRIVPCINDHARISGTASEIEDLALDRHLKGVVQGVVIDRLASSSHKARFTSDDETSPAVAWVAGHASSSDFCTSLMANVTGRGGAAKLLGGLRRCPNPMYFVRTLRPEHVSWSTTPSEPSPPSSSSDEQQQPSSNAGGTEMGKASICRRVNLFIQGKVVTESNQFMRPLEEVTESEYSSDNLFRKIQPIVLKKLGELVHRGANFQAERGNVSEKWGNVSDTVPGPACILDSSTVIQFDRRSGGGEVDSNSGDKEGTRPFFSPRAPLLPLGASAAAAAKASPLASPSDYLAFLLTVSWDGGFSSQLEAAVRTVGPAFPRVSFVKGDGSAFRLFSAQYKVTSFPKLLLFRDGLLIGRFRGARRSPADLATFLSNMTSGAGITTTVTTTTHTEITGTHFENSSSGVATTTTRKTITKTFTSASGVTQNTTRATRLVQRNFNQTSDNSHTACKCRKGASQVGSQTSEVGKPKTESNASVEYVKWGCQFSCESTTTSLDVGVIPQALISPFAFRLPPHLWENQESAVGGMESRRDTKSNSNKSGTARSKRANSIRHEGGETHNFAYTIGGFGFGLVGYGGLGDFSFCRSPERGASTSSLVRGDMADKIGARGASGGALGSSGEAIGAATKVARVAHFAVARVLAAATTRASAPTPPITVDDAEPTEFVQIPLFLSSRFEWLAQVIQVVKVDLGAEVKRNGLNTTADWISAFCEIIQEAVFSLNMAIQDFRFVVWPPIATYIGRLDPVSSASLAYVALRTAAVIAAWARPDKLLRSFVRAALARVTST